VTGPQPAPAPGALAAVLAPDLVAIIGHLTIADAASGQVVALADAPAAVLDHCHGQLAAFHEAALAWAAGCAPAPCWQSWASRLALALGDLLGALDSAPVPDGRQDGKGGPA